MRRPSRRAHRHRQRRPRHRKQRGTRGVEGSALLARRGEKGGPYQECIVLIQALIENTYETDEMHWYLTTTKQHMWARSRAVTHLVTPHHTSYCTNRGQGTACAMVPSRAQLHTHARTHAPSELTQQSELLTALLLLREGTLPVLVLVGAAPSEF